MQEQCSLKAMPTNSPSSAHLTWPLPFRLLGCRSLKVVRDEACRAQGGAVLALAEPDYGGRADYRLS
jgi:hypothetical protein